MIDNEIHLFLDIAAVPAIHYHTYIHAVPPADQIVVNDVLHDMTGIVLTVIETGISQTNVGVVIFIGIVEIGLALDIIPLGHPDQECVDGVVNIGGDQCRIDFFLTHTGDGIGHIGGIGQRTDLRCQEVQNVVQNILPLNSIALHNILDIQLGVKIGQISLFILVICHLKDSGHTAVEHVLIQRFLLVSAHVGVELTKGEGIYPDLGSTSPEFRRDIAGKHPGIAAGDIDIQILVGFQFIQHIINANFDIVVFGIPDFFCELDLIYKQVKLFFSAGRNAGFYILTQGNGIAEFIIFPLIQFDSNDLIFRNTLFQEIVPEQFKKQDRLAATANACDDLDLAVMHMADDLVQIKFTLNHSIPRTYFGNVVTFRYRIA